jgi:hypothetical protein
VSSNLTLSASIVKKAPAKELFFLAVQPDAVEAGFDRIAGRIDKVAHHARYFVGR